MPGNRLRHDLHTTDTVSHAFLFASAGRPPIQDEFTDLPLSPQKKHRLRRKRDGLCVDCGRSRPCHRHSPGGRRHLDTLQASHRDNHPPVTTEEWFEDLEG